MSYYLELQFCPTYRQLLDADPPEYEIEMLSNINYCKIMSSLRAIQNKTTIEQGTLLHFELLVNSWSKITNSKCFFDGCFSEHMKRDVIAPSITFSTYTMELFEREDEDDEDDPHLELFNHYYQNGRKGKSVLPMLIVKNPYVIERATGYRLPIPQRTIIYVGLDFANACGYRYYNCVNYEILHETKD